MSDTPHDGLDIDPQLLQEFLAESTDSLDTLDAEFVALEKHPDDLATVDRIFRPVHSIKGNSSFFGLTNVKNFSHTMENLLQEIRSHKRKVTKPIIDALLRGMDLLRGMMERIRGGDLSTDLLPEEQEALDAFAAIAQSEEATAASLAKEARDAVEALAAADAPDALRPLIEQAQRSLRNLLQVVQPGAAGAGGDGVDGATLLYLVGETEVTDAVRTVSGFVKEVQTAEKEQARVDAFRAALKTLRAAGNEAGRATLLEACDAMHNDFETIHESGIGFDDLLASLLQERIDQMLTAVEVCDKAAGTCTLDGRDAGPIPSAVAEGGASDSASSTDEKAVAEKTSAPTRAPAAPKNGTNGGGKTLRVAEEKVDSFMSYVGELIIANEVFAYIQKKLEGMPGVREVAQEFKNANLTFYELSTDLQKSLMSVRRLPLRSVVQKLPRIVRDLSGEMEKEIALVIEGDDVQIDKSLLEGIENPLVHMVRNSVDHGIESPAEREAAGKPARGTVRILAEADEETFRLTISDDGKGLDLEAIKAKAVAKGMVTEEKVRQMTDSEAYQLIFGAGVSTAKKVTDVSGRGVGMDVVMSNITKLNGKIDVASTLGQGTTMVISLPMTVTLLVIDGLVADVGGEQYIVPLTEVRESVRPRPGDVHTVSGKGEMLNVRGELYRLVRLYDVFGLAPATREPAEATVILVEGKGGTCGLLVDDILAQQSVVLKDLGKQFVGLDFLQGAAILGDGRVGLVLDVDGLLEHVN